jgi:hypothetical protein
MLDWLSDTIFSIVTYLPPWFVDPDSPRFVIIRGMFGLLLILAVVLLIAMVRPFGAAIKRRRLGRGAGKSNPNNLT